MVTVCGNVGAGVAVQRERRAARQPPSVRAAACLHESGRVGLVIAPWNAPILLCVLPLMGMLSAGNLCVIKPSETTKACSRLLAKLIPQYFPCRSVLVAEGGPVVACDEQSLVDAAPARGSSVRGWRIEIIAVAFFAFFERLVLGCKLIQTS